VEWWIRLVLIVGLTMAVMGIALLLRLGSRESLGAFAPFSRGSPVERELGVVVLLAGIVLSAIADGWMAGYRF
jgi:hypothetical protein